MICILAEPWIAQTTVNFELIVVWQLLEDFLVGRVAIKDQCDHTINKIGGDGECIAPISSRHLGLREKCETGFH